MRIIKPKTLGLLQKPYRYRQQHHLAIGALGFFRLGEATERFMNEQDAWPAVMKALPANEVLDFAMPKGRGEMLLSGSACVAGAKPVARMNVRATLGAIDKTLSVIGDREWLYGLVPFYRVTEPTPFIEMPIDYTRAYGGPTCSDNLLGQGHIGWRPAAFVGENRGRMPNVEAPDMPVRSGRRKYMPAGFGPLDIRSPVRQAKAGTYNKKWLEHDFPGLPDDVDWTLFNAAPADQQIDGFFAGGEPYRLEGFHPQQPLIEGRLPERRVRAFVQRRGKSAASIEEVALVLDTVWFFPTPGIGVGIYRGQIGIDDSDALDVETVFLGYEAAADTARPITHYQEALALRLDSSVAPLHLLNDAPLSPDSSPEERAARTARRAQLAADDLAARQATLDESMAEFWESTGMTPPPDFVPPKAEPSPLPPISAEAIARGDIDLAELHAKTMALAEAARVDGEAKLKAVPPVPPPSLPQMVDQLKAAEARASIVAHDLVGDTATLEAYAHKLLGDAAAAYLTDAQRKQVFDTVMKMPALQRHGRRFSPKPLEPAASLAPPVALYLGRKVREWMAAGISLVGRDLAGANLAKMKFAGADLREAMFEHADLSGADFRNASLQGAVFTNARLDGADFSGADLTNTNFSAAQASGALFHGVRLVGALLSQANFTRADFTGADFSDTLAQQAIFDEARLDQCRWNGAAWVEASAEKASFVGANFERTILLNAKLAGADFSAAMLLRTVLMNANAEASRWRGARLTRVQAGGTASFARADLREVIAKECGWRGTDLRGADLSDGKFAICDFGTCNFDGARLNQTLMFRSILMQSLLTRCETDGSDFFQSLCRKSDWRETSTAKVKLAHVDLSEARFHGEAA